HLFWLSEKLGRTPFSVAFQIAAIRELQDGWEEQFREISDNIRLSGLSISDYLTQNGTGHNA
ncbi:TPA: DNA-binding protein, partial [Klebsiella pneumoniae]|nr:DNA-binding protein [Salmonella enterica subsp. enterica]EFK3694707.1 DNA-binding protein [Escherichia coli]MBF8036190.1 DNA-binding protein [Klebsiella pneumoniae]HBY0475901.1 DNA-binding protein [Klebsiella pneumoniae subsp. pneumoniae]HDS4945658.1 DNA-binding protein [Klebsiella pneumoniae subsp. ozaenae]HDS6469265.1 DNA-binding protein [Klebsiella michiganensis]HDT5990904.1 DNA-binding protein [Raoultella planticola]